MEIRPKMRISKAHFYRLGGLASNHTFRRMRGGAWTYWWLP
jgi:hypothetical protein